MLHSDTRITAPSTNARGPGAVRGPVSQVTQTVPVHFNFNQARPISTNLPIRSSKQTMTPFTFPRAALFALLLATALSSPAQSIWRAETSRSMVADYRARAIGDVLTILVQENNTASKDNSTKTGKATSIDASVATFLYSPAGSGFMTHNGEMPALKTMSKQNFDGGGSINNSEKITTRIGVRVVDVLPNGNLVIEGQRSTSFSGESQDVVLRGVVRAEDITPNNTLFSYNIADATIKYVSKGTITNNQRKGWFTKLWELFTPF